MATANARFIFWNSWDEADLTFGSSGSETPTLPLSNTQRYNNSRTWRTTDTAEQQIKVNLAFTTVISGFTLWRHNLTEDGTVRVRAYDGPNQTGNVIYDSGWLPALFKKTLGELAWGRDPLGASAFTNWRLKYSSYWLPKENVRSLLVQISDPTNPDGFLEIGRIYAGEYFEPKYNFDLGHAIRWESTTQQNPTAGGSVHTLETETYRVLDFSLSHLDEQERVDLFEATRRVSNHRDIFVSLSPAQGGAKERDYSFAAKMTEAPQFRGEAARFTNNFTFREV
ncbi:MAG: hypothetical protein CMK92_05205 [Pseudomonas sp.]|nr:hypothetical protein [Pseudomonas sp.]